jgi:hypothetical protein
MKHQLKTQNKLKKSSLNMNYEALLSQSLVIYADQDKYFAELMYREISGREVGEGGLSFKRDKAKIVSYIMPSSTDMALRRLDYVLSEYGDQESVLAPLYGWAKSLEDEMPKNIVVGLVGMAIPGPTMGIIKKRYNMNFLVTDFNKICKEDLVKKGLDASFSIVASNIKKKKGDANRLEPELYDWLFGDREISFYQASADKLEEVKSELVESGLSFAEMKNEDRFIGLALSPVVDREYFSDLKRIIF